ncbi:uncharacterized protein VTP21DRAFT_6354 [Calcarisporiella thermophila]|uniref:uncharacterized protein n=1 Tax=Calcarisporiella thermophila TaxID=911321 RepID=UPI003742C361
MIPSSLDPTARRDWLPREECRRQGVIVDAESMRTRKAARETKWETRRVFLRDASYRLYPAWNIGCLARNGRTDRDWAFPSAPQLERNTPPRVPPTRGRSPRSGVCGHLPHSPVYRRTCPCVEVTHWSTQCSVLSGHVQSFQPNVQARVAGAHARIARFDSAPSHLDTQMRLQSELWHPWLNQSPSPT